MSTIVTVNSRNGKYSKPKVASFSGKYHDLEPFLSPDGLRLYFSSDRPLDNKSNE
ncbi:MAG: PD40 domain-containing protein [Bacteroidetes bacterium]|nr:PD40 domain-containing protein [Bacteroidota bacterium]